MMKDLLFAAIVMALLIVPTQADSAQTIHLPDRSVRFYYPASPFRVEAHHSKFLDVPNRKRVPLPLSNLTAFSLISRTVNLRWIVREGTDPALFLAPDSSPALASKSASVDYENIPNWVGVSDKRWVADLFATLKTEVAAYPYQTQMLADLQLEYTKESTTLRGLDTFIGKMYTYRQYVSVPFASNTQKVEQLLTQLSAALTGLSYAAMRYRATLPPRPYHR